MTNQYVSVVGTGYWGKNIIRNFHELGVLHSVCDANLEVAKQFSDKYNIDALNWETVLKNADIKAIAIAVPAVLHAKFAKEAILAGKHVFIEKPIALDTKDAQELNVLAVEHNKVLMVGHLLQYHPAYIKLKEFVQQGNLGELQYLYSNRLSLGKVRTEEDVLWSFAPHDLSMILGLVQQDVKSVNAIASNCLTSSIADTVTTHIEFESGLKAHVLVSWMHPFKEQRLIVMGSKAMAVFDDTKPWDSKLELYKHSLGQNNGVPEYNKSDAEHIKLEEKQPLKEELQHFINCIENNQQPTTDGKEALAVLTVLQKASVAMARSTDMNKTNRKYFVHESSYVDQGVEIGEGSKIWHYSHILGNTTLGRNCIIGQNVMIGPDVTVGNNCKIQNNVSLYKGVKLGNGVFCGPSCVFTNVNNPRAEIERKDEFRITEVENSVTIGANATIVCGTRLGAYSFIGAGAVVTKDVKPHALVVGNPARQLGWVSHAGERLGDDLICPREGRKYKVNNNQLEEVTYELNKESA